MKTEKVILSFIALLAGLLVAGVGFYLYQSTKALPSSTRVVSLATPTPSPLPSSLFLSIETPKDEEVIDKKTVSVTGKTVAGATIIVHTPASDQVVTPAQNGDFSVTITLNDGANFIEIRAINPTGEEARISRTITFSTETF